MFFQLKEFLSWLGLTVFEVTTFAISFLVFTVLLTLKTELQFLDWKTADSFSWWHVFAPLFVSDALNAYFCIIVFIRQYLKVKSVMELLPVGMSCSQTYRAAFRRFLWSFVVLALLSIFKYLLCQKLIDHSSGKNSLDNSKVLSPVFILLQFVMVRACNLHST